MQTHGQRGTRTDRQTRRHSDRSRGETCTDSHSDLQVYRHRRTDRQTGTDIHENRDKDRQIQKDTQAEKDQHAHLRVRINQFSYLFSLINNIKRTGQKERCSLASV